MDSLIDKFNNTSIIHQVSYDFLKDLNIIINAIIEYFKVNNNFNINTYDLLVSYGADLTWNMDYYISLQDYDWFSSKGNVYIFNELNKNEYIDISFLSYEEYDNLMTVYSELVQLFSLQVH
mgnify:CR=1 FL=1